MVESKSGKIYSVELVSLANCSTCTPDKQLQPTCTREECSFLCRHMYKCDPICYDFQNGHLCKDVHCVHALHVASNSQACSTSTRERSRCSSSQPENNGVWTQSHMPNHAFLFHKVGQCNTVYLLLPLIPACRCFGKARHIQRLYTRAGEMC